MSATRAVDRYLERHAEPELVVADAIEGAYDDVVVVPACREGAELCAALDSVATVASSATLVIVVVNGRADANDETHARNEETLRTLHRRQRSPTSPTPYTRHGTAEGIDLLVVDRATPGRRFGPTHGVGRARKLGCDVAVALARRGALRSGWIHCFDADAVAPSDYFARTRDAPESVGLTLPFWHRTDDSPAGRARALYEISLRHYLLGLEAAGSPYAFHAVGSTMAFRAVAYAQVGGIPNRMAAEDFYFLDKLAKVGPIRRAGGAPIELDSRPSDRVPFGTGVATARIAGDLVDDRPFALYDPACFTALGGWLRALDDFSRDRDLTSVERRLADAYPALLDAVGAHLPALADAARHTRSSAALRRRLHTWFDGFRTMKLVHALRDTAYPNVGWRDALGVDDAPLETVRTALYAQEQRLHGTNAGLR